jgi:hypothetical protein
MIAALAIGLASIQMAFRVDFPWARLDNASGLACADIIAIVTAEADETHRMRQRLVPLEPGSDALTLDKTVWGRNDRVQASSGRGVRPGEELRIFAPDSLFSNGTETQIDPKPSLPKMELKAGHRYLLFAFRSKPDRLSFPSQPEYDRPLGKFNVTYEIQGKDEVAAVMMFPTNETSIPSNPTDNDVRLSVIKTLDQTDSESYRRVVTFLAHAGPQRGRHPIPGFGTELYDYAPPDAATRALEAVLPRSNPYQQSKVWGLLFNWQCLGSTKGYIRSLRLLADDPDVYRIENGDYLSPNEVHEIEFEPGWPLRFKSTEYVDLVTNSRNTTIVEFFLTHATVTLELKQCKKLARLLLDPDPRIREAVANRLADLNGDAAHKPLENRSDVDRCIKYWIDFYGVKPGI